MSSSSDGTPREHHKKSEVSFNRPAYREARWERAVKVYTVNDESRYLIIQNVPSIQVERELLQLSSQFGVVEEYEKLKDYPRDKFTDVYWIKYKRIQSARFGKRKLDNHSFFGSQLHVCYAPEYETVSDVRTKLLERKRLVERKCKEYVEDESSSSNETISPSNQTFIRDNRIEEKLQITSSRKSATELAAPYKHSNNVVSEVVEALNRPVFHEKHQGFPRIPSHNASLPKEIQNLRTEDVYSSDFLPKISTNSLATPIDNVPIDKKTISTKMENNATRKRIVWNRQSDGEHQYTKKPGAWDPYKETRTKNTSQMTSSDDLETRDCIREQLNKISEPPRKINVQENKICPLQLSTLLPTSLVEQRVTPPVEQPEVPKKKQRKSDGRKRI